MHNVLRTLSPNAITCCRFSSVKTLLMLKKGTLPDVGIDVLEFVLIGRFWVATEASGRLANQGITSFGFKPSPVKSRLKATYNC